MTLISKVDKLIVDHSLRGLQIKKTFLQHLAVWKKCFVKNISYAASVTI